MTAVSKFVVKTGDGGFRALEAVCRGYTAFIAGSDISALRSTEVPLAVTHLMTALKTPGIVTHFSYNIVLTL